MPTLKCAQFSTFFYAFVAVVTQTGGGTLFAENAAILWWVAPATCLIGALPVVFVRARYQRQHLDLDSSTSTSSSTQSGTGKHTGGRGAIAGHSSTNRAQVAPAPVQVVMVTE